MSPEGLRADYEISPRLRMIVVPLEKTRVGEAAR